MTNKAGTPYSAKYKDVMKRLLIERRMETIGDLKYYRESTIDSSDREGVHENTTYASHPADQGTDAQEREKAFMFAQREGAYMQQLEDALQRLEQGVYGICTSCGGKISIERLKAVPTAKECKDCKGKSSQTAGTE